MPVIANIAKWLARVLGLFLLWLCTWFVRDIQDADLILLNMIPFFLVLLSVALGWLRPYLGAIAFFGLAGLTAALFPYALQGAEFLSVIGLLFVVQWALQRRYRKTPTQPPCDPSTSEPSSPR